MSQVKFEKETVRATTGGGKEDFIHKIGEAVTKSSGADGYLAVSIYAICHCSALLRAAEARTTQEARS
jgi:hypothetical protein